MHFDEHAQNWDLDPMKTERAKVFAEEINAFIKPNKNLNAMEFGCGTGLLSFQLKDNFKAITLVDNSEGMIKVLKEKIEAANIRNFIPLYITSLEDSEIGGFDVIYTLMTMHHVLDLEGMLSVFHKKLNSNAYLCIADIVKEDGSFHANHPGFDGHNGFEKEELSNLLSENGFEVVHYSICFEIEKKTEEKTKKYPLFLMIAKKL